MILGRYTAPEMYEAGGMAVVANRLLEAGILHPDELTVSGRTIGEEARAGHEKAGQQVIRPLENPLKGHGGIVVLRGNLAPDGCVAKTSGHGGPSAHSFFRVVAMSRALFLASAQRCESGAAARWHRTPTEAPPIIEATSPPSPAAAELGQ